MRMKNLWSRWHRSSVIEVESVQAHAQCHNKLGPMKGYHERTVSHHQLNIKCIYGFILKKISSTNYESLLLHVQVMAETNELIT